MIVAVNIYDVTSLCSWLCPRSLLKEYNITKYAIPHLHFTSELTSDKPLVEKTCSTSSRTNYWNCGQKLTCKQSRMNFYLFFITSIYHYEQAGQGDVKVVLTGTLSDKNDIDSNSIRP